MPDEVKPKPTTSTAIEPRRPLPFEPANLDDAYRFCEYLSKASLVPEALKGKPSDLMIILLAGRDFGLTVTEAFRGINVIKGRPALAAAFKIAKARQHPDCEFFRLVETSDRKATFECKRKGDPEPTRVTWTIEQAGIAGLTNGDNWKKYPSAMLRWRAGGALADAVFSDAFYGAPTIEELETEVNDQGTYVAKPMVAAPAIGPKKSTTQKVKDAVLGKDPKKGVVVQRADLGQTEEQALNGEPPPEGDGYEPGDSRHDEPHDPQTGELPPDAVPAEPGSEG